jgi:hypothetical protein
MSPTCGDNLVKSLVPNVQKQKVLANFGLNIKVPLIPNTGHCAGGKLGGLSQDSRRRLAPRDACGTRRSPCPRRVMAAKEATGEPHGHS